MAKSVSWHTTENKIGRCVFQNAVAVAMQHYQRRSVSILSKLRKRNYGTQNCESFP